MRSNISVAVRSNSASVPRGSTGPGAVAEYNRRSTKGCTAMKPSTSSMATSKRVERSPMAAFVIANNYSLMLVDRSQRSVVRL